MTKDEVQEDCLKTIVQYNRSTAALGTGIGKTRTGLLFLEHHYQLKLKTTLFPLKILIVAPKKVLFAEWAKEIKQWKFDHLLDNITFSTYISLTKHDPIEYDLVVFDECHSIKESHLSFLTNYSGIILGLTGTPPVNEYTEKYKIIQKYLPVVYTYLVDDAIDDNILNDYHIYVHELHLGKEQNVEVKLKNKPSFFTTEKDNYAYWTNRLLSSFYPKEKQMNNIMRMKALMTYPSKELYAKKLINHVSKSGEKLIVFANTQEQADKLSKFSYHSNNSESEDNLNKFKSGEIKILSSVMQLSEGVNIPDLKQCIIMHAYGNERKSNQRLGRMVRLSPDDKAVIHILCFKGTVDEDWVNSALSALDSNKITWKDFNITLY
jgi:superfamily II DNA or RNA helicase